MAEATTATFLQELWALQHQRGLTDAALARLLGIGHPYLSRLKTGKRKRVSFDLALAIIREFPDLAPFLSRDLPTSQPILPTCKDEGAA
jgi:transcriptional regulator with XRE-family HTH domain